MNKEYCPICDSDKFEYLYTQNFYNKTISPIDKYNVVVCKECNFIFATPLPDQEEFNNYYSEISRYEFNHNDGVVSKSYIDYTNSIINFLTPYINRDSSILDIGCSTGTLLSLFQKRGYTNLFGIDPSISCTSTVKNRYNIDTEAATISTFNTNKKFDVIILSAVLEHVVDLKFSLNKIKSFLKEDGILFIEIPDASRFKDLIFTPFQQFSIEHIRYFTKSSIHNLLASCNMQIINIYRTLNTGNQTIDPNLFVMCSLSNKKLKFKKNVIDIISIKKYIRKSKRKEQKEKNTLNNIISKYDKFLVWGVGTNTQRILGDSFNLAKIKYFIDSNINYVGKKLHDIDIILPTEIKDNLPILILTYSYQDEIINYIQNELKLNNEIITFYE